MLQASSNTKIVWLLIIWFPEQAEITALSPFAKAGKLKGSSWVGAVFI